MASPKIWFSLSALALLLVVVVADDVVVLNEGNFEQEVGKERGALVEFYAPWCGHCKKLAPEIEKLGATFKKAKSILIGKVLEVVLDEGNLKGQVLEITMQSLSETVSSLKEKIAGEIQLPANKQKLSGKAGFLKDNLSFAYYNIGTREVLTLALRERGGSSTNGWFRALRCFTFFASASALYCRFIFSFNHYDADGRFISYQGWQWRTSSLSPEHGD